jgi:hypothetical protein
MSTDIYMSFLYKKKKPKKKKVYLSRTLSCNYDKYDSNVYRCCMYGRKIICGHVVIPIDFIIYDTDLEGEIIEDNVIYIDNVWEHHDTIPYYYSEL